jgi:hypothetical protein
MKILTGFPHIKKLLQWLLYACYLILTVWGILEIAFRYQWIDFYAAELKGLTPAASLSAPPEKSRILLLGDSFSAQPYSYVVTLRDSLPELDIINAAVPGSGILEASIIAADKIKRFPPDVLVYQVYVGNDLWDIRKSWSSPHISLLRKFYWRLSDYSLSLRYLNYRLGQFRSVIGKSVEIQELKHDMPFSASLYSKREQMLMQAEPTLIHDSIRASGKRGKDLAIWFKKMDQLLSNLSPRTQKVVLLILPHCVQVNDFYRRNLESLGGMPLGPEIQELEYPFLELVQEHYANQPQVSVYSPLSIFQQSDSTGHRFYYENDPHLNDLGHLILGQALVEYLKK